jgi:hypothetical protein
MKVKAILCAACVCAINIFVCFGFDKRTGQENYSQSIHFKLTFEKPSIAGRPGLAAQEFPLEKRIIKTQYSGHRDAEENTIKKEKEAGGLKHMTDILSRLFNRISAAPIIPLNMVGGSLDTINAYGLSANEADSIYRIVKYKFHDLISVILPEDNMKDIDMTPDLNMLLRMYI